MGLSEIDESLRGTGIFVRGAFHPGDGDGAPTGARTLVLLGNAGAAMWRAFQTQASELRDLASHPLQASIRKVVGAVADRFRAKAVFPFDGPPFPPFQRWAMRAEAVYPSPIGILIHPTYGLWHAYRGALGCRELWPLPPRQEALNLCESCRDRPCLRGCPVGAFRAESYDLPACVAHLRSSSGRACLDRGCRARLACPVGAHYRYEPAQAAFHMRGFLANV